MRVRRWGGEENDVGMGSGVREGGQQVKFSEVSTSRLANMTLPSNAHSVSYFCEGLRSLCTQYCSVLNKYVSRIEMSKYFLAANISAHDSLLFLFLVLLIHHLFFLLFVLLVFRFQFLSPLASCFLTPSFLLTIIPFPPLHCLHLSFRTTFVITLLTSYATSFILLLSFVLYFLFCFFLNLIHLLRFSFKQTTAYSGFRDNMSLILN